MLTTAVVLGVVVGVLFVILSGVLIAGWRRVRNQPGIYAHQAALRRVQQNRAAELARSALASLPVFRFTQPEGPPKPTNDVELTERPQTDAAKSADARVSDAQPGTGGNQSGDLGIQKSTADARAHAQLACVICTEDFVTGDELRLLPCGHRYHVACVDPWLMKGQKTCPMCRIDLDLQIPKPEPAQIQ